MFYRFVLAEQDILCFCGEEAISKFFYAILCVTFSETCSVANFESFVVEIVPGSNCTGYNAYSPEVDISNSTCPDGLQLDAGTCLCTDPATPGYSCDVY